MQLTAASSSSVVVALCCLCFLQTVFAIPEGPHINTLNVLLPPKTTHPVRFRLQGSGGCFTWTWDHHDIIHVNAEFNGTEGCSDSAVITSIAPYDGRRVTAVYAKDTLTGQVIRCEVFIDKVSRIRISHHSLKLDLDGLATLRIHAFDKEDNVFSSLVGVQFLWRLLPSRSHTGILIHCLTHVPLKDTPLSDCGCVCGDIDTQIELEDKGLGSDLLVVRGVSVGQERVSVNVLEQTLEDLGDEIGLTIAEAISIEPPSPLYVLVDTQVQYTLKTLRYKLPSAIQLPSPHHHWSTMDPAIAEVDQFMGTLYTRSIGSTSVIVEDIRVTGHQQIASLHVVVPSRLQLYLTPLSFKDAGQQAIVKREGSVRSSDVPWYLVVGWDYVVQVMAFSAESVSAPLYLTKGNYLSFSFDEWPYWKSIAIPEDVQHEQGWHNGTLIKAVSEGGGRLAASLKYKKSLREGILDEALTVEQEVIVCSPVLILFENEESSNVLSLPWFPKVIQAYQLRVQGGCGSQLSDYQWLSLDPTVAAVNSLGVVHAKGLGQGVVRAMALTNPMNADEVAVQISCPSAILRIEGLPSETEVGSYLPAAVTLKNPDGLYYSNCESFFSLIDWKITDGEASFVQMNYTRTGSFERSFQDSPTLSRLPSICGWNYFLAVRPGRATVTASLAIDDSFGLTGFSTSNKLFVSWTIAAYAPLTIVQAGDGHSYGGYDCGLSHLETLGNVYSINQCQLSVLLLVPGSSMKVMLKGGPERWGQGVEFIERHDIISSQQEKGVERIHVSHLTSGGGRLYDITCCCPGNNTVIFYRGNSVGEDHPAPAVAAVNLSVTCSVPSSITLLVDDVEHSLPHIKASAQAHRDQNRVHKSPVTVVSGRGLRVAAVALDALGSPFANASSLPIHWMLVDCVDLAYWERYDTSKANIENGRWEENLVLRDNAGQCLIKASVGERNWLVPTLQPLNSDILKQGLHILTDAVQLQLVTSLKVAPKFLLLYNHIDAKGVLTVLGGSNHIEARSNDTKVALVLEQPMTPHALHMTVAARGLGVSLITVQDVGLITPASDTALVCVAEVAWVRLLLPEEASIQVGSLLAIKMEAGDNMGNIFSDSQLEFMDIQVHVKDEVLELVHNKGFDKGEGNKVLGSSFTIRGANVGVTDLYVSIWSKYGHDVVSELRKVEVYEPLSIQPEGLVLAPGARYVVWVRGGPSIGVSVKFSSYNDTIVSVENSVGMISANFPGIVFIYAQAITHGGTVVCKAALEVRVHVPTSMILNVRGGQLALGRKMSLFPTGTQEDLFSFYELCRNYKWTVGDPQVLTVYTSNDLKRDNGETSSTSMSSEYAESGAVDARFSVVAVGRSAGKTDITVGFSCHFHSKTGYSSTHFYTASGTIQVIPDPPLALGMLATWLLPPNYKTSSLLPQCTDSGLDSTTSGKRSIVYSMLQDSSRDSVSISLEGAHIKTSERQDVACVQARDRRTGRSEVAVCLRVAEVSQMIVGDLEFSIRRMEISVGAYHLYFITLQDDIGTPFFEAGDAVHLTAETDRVDVVSVKVLSEDDADYTMNATVLVQALKQGTAMIRISQLGNPTVVDYILIHVGAFIIPRNPSLHVGGNVNFSIVGKGLSLSEQGHWLSSNSDVIQINQHTGEAFALGPGSTSVSFNSSHLMAFTTATVVQISSISVRAPEGQLTNVQNPEKGYHFLVKFRDPRGQDIGLVATDQRVSYNCHVDPPYIGRCLPWRDPEDEKAYCVFHPYSPERLFLTLQGLREEAGSTLVVGDSKGCLTIKMIAEVTGMPEVGSILASFAGGFKIRDKAVEILLTPSTNKTKLTVVGSAGGVDVSWTRTDALEVKRVSSDRDAYGFGGHAVFEIRVINEEQPFVSNLTFRLPTTGQVEEIRVEYDVKDRREGALLQQIVTAAIFIVVLGVLPFVVCARLFDLPRRRHQESITNDVGAVPSRERVANGSPVSPVRNLQPSSFESPQSVSLSRSPPQPYTEYVSKTIENTPYFRREGVRRFDPSRTY